MLDIRQLKVENRQTLLQLGFDPISLLTKPVCGPQIYGTQFRPDVSTYHIYFNLVIISVLIILPIYKTNN